MLLAALLLGGASRQGLASDLVLQLVAIPLLAFSLWRWVPAPGPSRRLALVPVALLAAMVGIALLQLVPLPPAVWQALPGREIVAETFRSIEGPTPWLPVSVAPVATISALMALVVPASIFLAVTQLDARQRRMLTIIVLGVAAASVLLGLTQVASGKAGAFRLYAFTNPTEATGFFANRNHYSAFLYCAFLLAAVWTGEAHRRFNELGRKHPSYIAILAGALALLLALLAAQSMARSRAGLLLALLAMAGALALALMTPRQTQGRVSTTKLLAGVFVIASALAAQFALYRIVMRFESDALEDARLHFAQTTAEAAYALLPFGSGLGTFAPLYGTLEKIENLLPNTFANRAHNDLLEFWLEFGLGAAVIVGAFIIWLAIRATSVWRRHQAHSVDVALARAAVLIIVLLMLHSLVDYPLRTGAIAAIFALACGLLTPSPRSSIETNAARSDTGGLEANQPLTEPRSILLQPKPWIAPAHSEHPAAGPAVHASPRSDTAPKADVDRWQSAKAWPDEWKKGKD